MTTNNSINVSLVGQNGTGNFVGNNSPSFSGTVTALTSFEIPNSATPSVSTGGHIALDTSISSFKPTVIYNNGVSNQALIAVKSSNLSITDGDIISYDASNQEFKMQAAASATGKAILQYGFSTLGSNAITTSSKPTSTGLTINITPTSSTNKICCEIFGKIQATRGTSVPTERYGIVYIIRTVSGTPTTLSTTNVGRILPNGSSSNHSSLLPFKLYFEEVPGSTTTRTYSLSFSSPTSQMDFTVFSGSFIHVYEKEV